MRKFIILILALIVSTSLAQAADKEFDKIFNKYSRVEGCQSVKIGKGMIRMMAGDNKQLSGIEKILVLTANPSIHPHFSKEIMDYVKKNPGFEEMATIHDSASETLSYFMDSDKGECVFLLLNIESNETVAIYINGDFSLKNISEIVQMVK